MPGFSFKLIPPRPDLRSTMAGDECTTLTEILPMLSLVMPSACHDATG